MSSDDYAFRPIDLTVLESITNHDDGKALVHAVMPPADCFALRDELAGLDREHGLSRLSAFATSATLFSQIEGVRIVGADGMMRGTILAQDFNAYLNFVESKQGLLTQSDITIAEFPLYKKSADQLAKLQNLAGCLLGDILLAGWRDYKALQKQHRLGMKLLAISQHDAPVRILPLS